MRRIGALWLFSAVVAVVLAACDVGDFTEMADRKFGDQHFKTAIALVELHRVRFGKYPASLDDLRFTGEWDQIALNAVDYRRTDRGYRLSVERGWVGEPELDYPEAFWRGLGIERGEQR